MNATKLTTRVVTVALAVAGSACQPRGAAAAAGNSGGPPEGGAGLVEPAAVSTPLAPTPPAQPAVTRPAPPSNPREAAAQAKAQAARLREVAGQQREVANTLRAGAASGGGGMGGAPGKPSGMSATIVGARGPMTDEPVVLTTEITDPSVEGQWEEDLRVMDVLLKNATGGTEGGLIVFGIKTSFGRVTPMYVEGAGVVFSLNVGWPLAPSGKEAEADAQRPRERPSAWVTAQRQLKGEGPVRAPGREAPPLVFEQEKLDAYVDAIVKVLPEATNFRHLKDTESVFVTVSGPDESGEPVRLTLKVRKSDVDAAARGTLDAAAFRQRVARRIG